MTGPDLTPDQRATEPTEPGWYAYSGGRQTMIFHLRETRDWKMTASSANASKGMQWSAHFDNGTAADCAWGYIEQALGVWDLVRLDPPWCPRPSGPLRGSQTVRLVFTHRPVPRRLPQPPMRMPPTPGGHVSEPRIEPARVYPVGWLDAWRRHRLRSEWRYTLRQAKAHNWRAVRNTFNGYLCEHDGHPHNCGRGWTKRAAIRRAERLCAEVDR